MPNLIRSLWVLAVVLGLARPLIADDLDRAERALNERFKGKRATTKIDLPWRRSLYVALDGSHDEKRYYERIRASEKILRVGETLPIHHLAIEEDHINVCLGGPQCGQAWKPRSSKTIKVFGGPGFRIEIEFGRAVTAADATPATVLRALSRVLAIEGEVPPSDFSMTAVLGAPPAAGAGARGMPPPPAGPGAGSSSGSGTSGTPGAARPVIALTLLSAEVQPTTAAPGAALRLVAHFEVSGGLLPVTEERQLYFAERALLSNPTTTTQDWPPGRHSTSVEFRLPAGAERGVYTFRLVLRGGGKEQRKEALFVVQ